MDKAVLVAGAGISGIGAAKLLHEAGVPVIVYDSNASLGRAALAQRLGFADAQFALGDLPDSVIARTSECVISPGIDLQTPFVLRLREAGVPVIGEIELACRYAKGTLIAVTGTNGKTTTAALTGAIMKKAFGSAFTVRDEGTAFTQIALRTTEDSVTTAECSSFQLETVDRFRPHIAAILNITPDHLNRHGTMEEYARVKELVTKNQGPEDWCVLNYEDERLRAFGETVPSRVVWFSAHRRLPEGLYAADGEIRAAWQGTDTALVRADELKTPGRHSLANACAAAGCALAAGADVEVIRETLRSFAGLPHRLEPVGEKNGVRYYNDSKATNVAAAVCGIRAMSGRTVLIGGGYDKGASYDEWFDAFDGKVKKLVLIGRTRGKIAACAERHGMTDWCFADSLEEAVRTAADAAAPGESVLLSPACAGYGMFRNYEERGDCFRSAVERL